MGSECSRKPVSLGLESLTLNPNFASTHVAISRRAPSKVRGRFGVENQVLLKLLRYHRLQASQLDLVVHLVLQLLLVARHIGLPACNFLLGVPEESIVPEKWSCAEGFPSSCCRITLFLQPPPCLQWVLPRVGNNVIRLVTRESHKRCMHLLQHKLQVFVLLAPSRSMSSVVISVTCSADHSNIISDSLITPAKNASVFFDHC